MRIGLAYNEKPEPNHGLDDAFVEWDDRSTIEAVEQALSLFGDVVRIEADVLFPQKVALARPHLVFNMAEGLRGPNREAHVPAICEFLSVPCTASDSLTLALALHKTRTKQILAQCGIATAPFVEVAHLEDLGRVPLPFPLFLKPVHEGSGKGIFVNNLCHSPAELRQRVAWLLERYRQPVLVETYLPGAEFTVAILGNGAEAECLPIVGIDFAALPAGATPVYGYEAKWVWDTPERPLDLFQCPAPVPASLARDIESVALAAYHALGCRDWCRVDVRLDAAGAPNVVELNPLPGIIPDPSMNSCFPKAARVAGLSYDELIQEVVRIAWKRITGQALAGRLVQEATA